MWQLVWPFIHIPLPVWPNGFVLNWFDLQKKLSLMYKPLKAVSKMHFPSFQGLSVKNCSVAKAKDVTHKILKSPGSHREGSPCIRLQVLGSFYYTEALNYGSNHVRMIWKWVCRAALLFHHTSVIVISSLCNVHFLCLMWQCGRADACSGEAWLKRWLDKLFLLSNHLETFENNKDGNNTHTGDRGDREMKVQALRNWERNLKDPELGINGHGRTKTISKKPVFLGRLFSSPLCRYIFHRVPPRRGRSIFYHKGLWTRSHVYAGQHTKQLNCLHSGLECNKSRLGISALRLKRSYSEKKDPQLSLQGEGSEREGKKKPERVSIKAVTI